VTAQFQQASAAQAQGRADTQRRRADFNVAYSTVVNSIDDLVIQLRETKADLRAKR
jgi:hypothetical protein